MIRDTALSILDVTKHQYYYRPNGKRSGRKPTKTSSKKEGNKKVEVKNNKIVEEIETIQSDPDTKYGYRKMYFALMMLGYYINHKKVYRLMKENNLLRLPKKRNERTYAKYRIVTPKEPLEVLEMDIKYVWVTQDKRHAYILTIIDTFTRYVLHWQVGFTMKTYQVQRAWEEVIINYLQPENRMNKAIHIEVRNDNGPQFSSKKIQSFFKTNYLNQVFTHPYTPQENGHIESFHSILATSIDKEIFWSIIELENRLHQFYTKYNDIRIHGSIANLSPVMFWNLWEMKKITRIELDNKKQKLKKRIFEPKLK
ncbi:MAG: transposase [Bacteroidetes bacterium 4572_77]|nr:MAG: transposase [Bacteroidetes bacterium 4572_77]